MKQKECKVTAWLYEPDEKDKNDRYVLGEVKIDLGMLDKVLICIGLNTSTAKPRDLDQTLKKVQHFTEEEKYENWIMFNLSPLGETNPKEIKEDENERLHKNNLVHIERVLKQLNNPTVLAAWGNDIEEWPFLKDNLKAIYKKIKKYKVQWKTIGDRTQKGHPRHPSRAAYELGLKDFEDIDEYIDSL